MHRHALLLLHQAPVVERDRRLQRQGAQQSPLLLGEGHRLGRTTPARRRSCGCCGAERRAQCATGRPHVLPTLLDGGLAGDQRAAVDRSLQRHDEPFPSPVAQPEHLGGDEHVAADQQQRRGVGAHEPCGLTQDRLLEGGGVQARVDRLRRLQQEAAPRERLGGGLSHGAAHTRDALSRPSWSRGTSSSCGRRLRGRPGRLGLGLAGLALACVFALEEDALAGFEDALAALEEPLRPGCLGVRLGGRRGPGDGRRGRSPWRPSLAALAAFREPWSRPSWEPWPAFAGALAAAFAGALVAPGGPGARPRAFAAALAAFAAAFTAVGSAGPPGQDSPLGPPAGRRSPGRRRWPRAPAAHGGRRTGGRSLRGWPETVPGRRQSRPAPPRSRPFPAPPRSSAPPPSPSSAPPGGRPPALRRPVR